MVCSKHLQDNDEDADGDEENDDSDCSGVGGPASTRCSSSAVDLRDVSGSSLNLQLPTFIGPSPCPRCHRAGARSRQAGTGKRRAKCVKLCVPTVPPRPPATKEPAPRPTQSGRLAPFTDALTTRRVSLPVPRVELRVVPAKKSRDDDDVRVANSSSDVRLTIDDDTERQLYTSLSHY